MLVGDINELPETQKTALVLREMDALSYDQIAEAMETTVPSVKSLLVRARVSLAEAAEARVLTCDQVRIQLAKPSSRADKCPGCPQSGDKMRDPASGLPPDLRRRCRIMRLPIAGVVVLIEIKIFIGLRFCHLSRDNLGGVGPVHLVSFYDLRTIKTQDSLTRLVCIFRQRHCHQRL